MSVNPVLDKFKWQVASRLPGRQSWDKMKLVDRGLQPLQQSPHKSSEKEIALPPQAQTNPFLRNVFLRKFQQAGIAAPARKTAAGTVSGLKHLWRNLRGGGAGLRSAASLKTRLGAGYGQHWENLFRETGRGGTFNNLTGQIGPAFGRMMGGSYLGHQFDSQEEGATPWGSLLGGIAGLGSPVALRKMLGNRNATKGTLPRLFADRTISRRLVNDPLNRIFLSAGTGNLVDLGAGALGYDTGGWGERLGLAGGFAGGLRPAAQALGGRYRSVGRAMNGLGKTFPKLTGGFENAQRGGFTHLPAYLLGSPYAVNAGMLPIMGHGVLDGTIGERVRTLADKKKMLTDAMNAPEMKPMQNLMEQAIRHVYGPQASFYDVDGTPSREAIDLMTRLGQSGMTNLQNAGKNWFGDPNYMLIPGNWDRLSRPAYALADLVRGQATRLNPLPF
jgi:hypothetical protein